MSRLISKAAKKCKPAALKISILTNTKLVRMIISMLKLAKKPVEAKVITTIVNKLGRILLRKIN